MTLVSFVTALHYKVSWNFVKAARSKEDLASFVSEMIHTSLFQSENRS